MLVNTSALLGMRVDEDFVSDKLESVSYKLFFWLLLFQTVFHASYDSTLVPKFTRAPVQKTIFGELTCE